MSHTDARYRFEEISPVSNAKLLHAQLPVISKETCNILAQCKLCLHPCSFDASVVNDAVNNFHFLFNFATVCTK